LLHQLDRLSSVRQQSARVQGVGGVERPEPPSPWPQGESRQSDQRSLLRGRTVIRRAGAHTEVVPEAKRHKERFCCRGRSCTSEVAASPSPCMGPHLPHACTHARTHLPTLTVTLPCWLPSTGLLLTVFTRTAAWLASPLPPFASASTPKPKTHEPETLKRLSAPALPVLPRPPACAPHSAPRAHSRAPYLCGLLMAVV
jgi:hypothetical protein